MSDGEAKKESKHKVYKLYKVNGDKVERTNEVCPKCGPGTFMANHKNRKTCGKCGFTQLNSTEQPKEAPAEAPKEEVKESPKEEKVEKPKEEVKEEPKEEKAEKPKEAPKAVEEKPAEEKKVE